jgi:preprotein translocase subunit SecE
MQDSQLSANATELTDQPKTSKPGFSPKIFLTEVVAEMKKVSWSTREELINYTGVVAIAVAVVCALIWICDTFFARLFHIILR